MSPNEAAEQDPGKKHRFWNAPIKKLRNSGRDQIEYDNVQYFSHILIE